MTYTLTNISNAAGVGVYRHAETGFTVHDVWSVADLLKANGALAIDMSSGSWSWVAGEDLFVEIYKKGGNTLATVARSLLKQVWQLCYSRICFGTMWKGDTTGWVKMTGNVPASRAVGNDIRLFGVHTNLQAGRGMSTDLLSSTIIGPDVGSTGTYGTLGYMKSDVMSHEGTNDYYFQNTLKDQHVFSSGIEAPFSYNKSDKVIGRGVIAIPLRSWDEFLAKWRSAVPNINEGEVASKADAAISSFNAVFRDAVFTVPSVRVPVILTSDGAAYVDDNSTRSITRGADGYNIGMYQTYNPLLSPTIVEENGLWVTNPHCPAPGHVHTMPGFLHEGINCNLFSPASYNASATPSPFSVPMVKINRIGGVDLFKIAGGFYPRVDSTKYDHTVAALVGRSFRGNHADQNVPTQLGAETAVEYSARIASITDSSSYGALALNYGHWHLCGQVALTVTTILDASLLGKTVSGAAMFLSSSGNLCRLMRVQNLAQISGSLALDVSSDPGNYLAHQYGG